ncbi:MAG TPA: metal ABC transporter substrate-binding protein [Dictyoglomaceae bacterium]|nr:metal ABC transporter substrate-binding protein [Dictyoglomaceae bacterium]HOL39368.1 metal ABC transporter substrate-binding protein [Dictyoglomaceae bacterium]HOP94817.1 metal ABC transporter substrate-binding protein [Dictyoglomaceae bacterium]HPP15950.1 metal ABC transporter substrate-binding protein [Dictyoglomaceae bacterium]HPU43288.1 metal ABC transporter substrate-binding protein [Dictyoglomaceae bacterium]
MKKILLIFILIIFTLTLSVGEKRTIAVSIPPLESITKYIVGKEWDVVTLLKGNFNPHIFEPTPQTMKDIERSQFVILNGGDVDLWAEKLIIKKNFIKVIENIKLDNENPHVWLDPILTKEIAKNISLKLISLDPTNRVYYENNLKNYNKKIDQLDLYIKKELSNFPKKEVIAYHPSWYYFFKRYNIKVITYIEEGEGKEPSPKKIAEIIQLIRKSHIKAIFKEPFSDPPILNIIQKETGVKIINLDPIGYNKDYFELIKENLSILKQVFYEQNH